MTTKIYGSVWSLDHTNPLSKTNLYNEKDLRRCNHSTKKTPTEASKKVNEKTVYFNLQDKRQKRQPKYKLGDLNRTADIKK